MKQIVTIDIKKLNEEEDNYLTQVLPNFTNQDLTDYLTQIKDFNIYINKQVEPSEYTNEILNQIQNVYENNHNFELYINDTPIHTIVIDIDLLNEYGHEYLKELFDFPDYYGNNLDALYDCLSELDNMDIVLFNTNHINEKTQGFIDVFEDVANNNENINLIYINEDED